MNGFFNFQGIVSLTFYASSLAYCILSYNERDKCETHMSNMTDVKIICRAAYEVCKIKGFYKYTKKQNNRNNKSQKSFFSLLLLYENLIR